MSAFHLLSSLLEHTEFKLTKYPHKPFELFGAFASNAKPICFGKETES